MRWPREPKRRDRRIRRSEDRGVLPGGRRVAAFSGFARTASRKLDQLDAAFGLRPWRRLEPLRGRRRGQWSIRINDQWRICFTWLEGGPGPADVEIVDYHRG